MDSRAASATVEGKLRGLLKCSLYLSLILALSLIMVMPWAEWSGVVLGFDGPYIEGTDEHLSNVGFSIMLHFPCFLYPPVILLLLKASLHFAQQVSAWVFLRDWERSFCHSRYALFFLSSSLKISSLFSTNQSGWTLSFSPRAYFAESITICLNPGPLLWVVASHCPRSINLSARSFWNQSW